MQNRKACFIIPYFGTLPNYLNIFLRTCSENNDYDWMIITDDRSYHPYPENVHVIYCSFDDFRNRIQSNFDFPISLPYPYKICDFRPAFGEIFAEELKEYRFWGHCDLDQYFGKISNFVTEEILTTYDKILCLGHFTLFRNCPEINSLYRKPDKTYSQCFEDAFSDSRHWIFDEWPTDRHTSINRIFKQEKIKTWLCPECFCDLQPFQSRFRRTLFNYETENWTDDQVKNEIFLWKNGKLYRCFLSNGKLKKEEILYVHIRQRKLKLEQYDENTSSFTIIPNAIESADDYSDNQIIKLLNKAQRRALLYPDEISRKLVLILGLFRAAMTKISKVLKG
ncbi:MAG: hypothetical protein PUC33_05165 [Oscillospiraceae bacterium]|nr:hypothetical protein [Oscillospiraceae bacterium]